VDVLGVRLTLRDFPAEQFLWGLGAATFALVMAMILTHGRAPRTRAAVPGLLVVAAALGAVGRTWPVTASTVLGLAGVTLPALGLWLARRPPAGTTGLVALGATVASACLLAADASPTAWVRGFLVAALVVSVPAAGRTDVEHGPGGLTPLLYAISAAGVFAAVPDTEQAAALLGASVPLAVRGWPFGDGRLGPPGAGAATALLIWVAAVGGRGREPSIVGAVGCLGLLVTLPAGRWLAGRTGRLRTALRPRRPVVPIVLVQLGVVALASRVAGVSADLAFASAVTAAVLLAALAASVLLAARPP